MTSDTSSIFKKGGVSTRDAMAALRRLKLQPNLLGNTFRVRKDRHGGIVYKVWESTVGLIPVRRVKQYLGVQITQTDPEFFNTNVPEQGVCVYGENAYMNGAFIGARLVLALFDPQQYIEVVGPSGRKSQWENKWTEEVHNEGQWAAYQNGDGVLINDFGLVWPVLGEIVTLFITDVELKIKPTLQSDADGYTVVSVMDEEGTVLNLATRDALAAYVAGEAWESASVGDLIEVPFALETENFKVLAQIPVNTRGWLYKTGMQPLSYARSRRLTIYGYASQVPVVNTEVFYAQTASGEVWRGQYNLGYGLFDTDCDGNYFDQIDVNGTLRYPTMGRVSNEEASLYSDPYSVVVLWHGNPEPCTIFLPPVPGAGA